jgi:hypothetical protein
MTLVLQNQLSSSDSTSLNIKDIRELFPLSYIDRQYSTSTPDSPFSQQNPSLPNFDKSKPLDQIVYTHSMNLTLNSIELIERALNNLKKESIIYPTKPLLHFESVQEMNDYLIKWTSDAVLIGVAFHSVDLVNNAFNFTLMYNGTNDRTLPQFSSVLTQALSDVTLDEKDAEDFKLPLLFLQENSIASEQDVFFIDNAIYSLTLGVTFMIPMIVQNVVVEVEKELKHQLFISGVSPTMFWASRFLCDYFIYLLVAIVQYICLAAVGKAPAFIYNSPIIPLVFYILYGINMLTFSYMFSFVFKKAEDAASM